MKFYLSFFASYLLFIPLFMAQSDATVSKIHEEVNNINAQSLYRMPLEYADECGADEYAFWFDAEGRLRKMYADAYEGCATDYSSSYMEYFDTEGNLIFHYFKFMHDTLGGEATGSFYYDKGTLVQQEINYLSKSKYATGPAIEGPVLFDENKSWEEYCLHLKASSVENQYDLKLKGSFQPEKGKMAIVRHSKVALKSEPTATAKSTLELEAFERVKIVEIGKEEVSPTYGKNNWMKVRWPGYDQDDEENPDYLYGWIFGAHLDCEETQK